MIVSQLKELILKKQATEGREIAYDEIVAATGISKSTLSRLANNRRVRYDAHVLSELCRYFECGVGDLIKYYPDQDRVGQTIKQATARRRGPRHTK
ncbi:MAG: helix-turn-helix domain-containing protein [Aggregatilineales bacterium]